MDVKTPEEIKKALKLCQNGSCKFCPYDDDEACGRSKNGDALAYIQQLESGKWDMFFEITSAYYGKQMYGLNNDGTVYSRYSCEEMTFEQAVKEFKELISGE
jgi:hypothetical protein